MGDRKWVDNESYLLVPLAMGVSLPPFSLYGHIPIL